MKYLLLSLGIAGLVAAGSFFGVKFYSHQAIAPQNESPAKSGPVASISTSSLPQGTGSGETFSPSNFRGPTGVPHVNGPSGPPPTSTKP